MITLMLMMKLDAERHGDEVEVVISGSMRRWFSKSALKTLIKARSMV